MARKFCHLTLADRKLIGLLRKQHKSIGEIAALLMRSKSTISRELKRQPHHGNYEASRADAHAKRLRKRPRRLWKMMVQEIEAFVKQGLEKRWSPEQIAGRLKRVCRHLSISHQCIYAWLYRDRKAGGQWYKYLRINRRKRYSLRYRGRTKISNRVGIEQRPPSVDSRRFFGDWEGDTVQGKLNSGQVTTLVERKSLFTMLAKAESKHAQSVNNAILRRFSHSPQLPMRTVTLDNGTEFSLHEELGRSLGANIYFAQPHCAWQRGLNENTNGLLRQYIPKKTDFREITAEMIAEIENELNNRPRKKLDYRTPSEALAKRFPFA